MTLPRYGPPDLAAPRPPVAPSAARTAVKAVLALVLVLAGVGGALLAGGIAYIVYSGCFLECTGGNPTGGLLLGLLALGLLLGLSSLAVVMWRTARTWEAVRVWAGVVLGAPALLLLLASLQGAF